MTSNCIYIVTPCRNMAQTINQTILSIVSQEGDFTIRYHIQDGHSTDGTLSILKRWKTILEKPNSQFVHCNRVIFTYKSESDSGMYNAIEKGFSYLDIPDSAFMTWLNADDKLFPQTLMLINSLQGMPAVNWITGNLYNFQQNNGLIFNYFVPFPPSQFIAKGICDLIHWSCLEQEGTFWRKWLWDKVGGIDSKFKFAGDWDLWRRFAPHSELVQVAFPLGAFRKIDGQLSSQNDGNPYQNEIDQTVPIRERKITIENMAEIGLNNLYYKSLNYAGDHYTIVEKAIGNSYPPWCQAIEEAIKKDRAIHSTLTKKKNEEIIIKSNRCSQSQKGPPKISNISNLVVNNYPNFFIVTPCLNAREFIDQTIGSVITQSGKFFIHYHVQDGCSEDGTIDKLRQWEHEIRQKNIKLNCQGVNFTWCSEPDKSMYDGIIKGFNKFYICPNDFMTWINSDDLIMPSTLSTIHRIHNLHPQIEWIGGLTYVIDNNVCIKKRDIPLPTNVIREGLCDGHHWHTLQQEGIFFKKRLWFKGRHVLQKYSFSGDWSLWREFAIHSEYFQCNTALGAFRIRKGQLSVNCHSDYQKEIDNTLPFKLRQKAFLKLNQENKLYRNLIDTSLSINKAKIIKDYEAAHRELNYRTQKISEDHP